MSGYGIPFTTRPEIQGTFGVAATTHWLATAVAMRMLERGGNAFDAAVAAAFTLQVVEPRLNRPALKTVSEQLSREPSTLSTPSGKLL
jgi:hypothetical protein